MNTKRNSAFRMDLQTNRQVVFFVQEEISIMVKKDISLGNYDVKSKQLELRNTKEQRIFGGNECRPTNKVIGIK